MIVSTIIIIIIIIITTTVINVYYRPSGMPACPARRCADSHRVGRVPGLWGPLHPVLMTIFSLTRFCPRVGLPRNLFFDR